MKVEKIRKVLIEIEPVLGRPGIYSVINTLITSKEPFLAAARYLVEEGWPEETILEMKHKGSPHISLRAKIGVAAKLTVDESNMRFTKWKPFPTNINKEKD